jgi:hypothetical protein
MEVDTTSTITRISANEFLTTPLHDTHGVLYCAHSVSMMTDSTVQYKSLFSFRTFENLKLLQWGRQFTGLYEKLQTESLIVGSKFMQSTSGAWE